MAIFNKLEKEKRQKLIFLYEQYISKGNLQDLEPLVDEVTFDSGSPVFSKIVNTAGFMIEKATIEEISIEDARRILIKLQSPLGKGL